MKRIYVFLILLVFACKSNQPKIAVGKEDSDFTIAFGSCNKHNKENALWDDVLAVHPDVWIWGGDNVYADTDDMQKLKSIYTLQNKVEGYQKIRNKIPVIGTWDDHDYGMNDGGVEFKARKESQQEFLDFMNVAEDSPRRSKEGIYTSHDYTLPMGSIKVIVLDTRYFRTALTKDNTTKKRNKPSTYGEGTILGSQQWGWLQEELNNSKADFNVIVSSIQFLSNGHGFECWGNFPHEVDQLKKLIITSKAKGVFILSGDRHISEFSKITLDALDYPLIDFTSSGLTHSYSNFSGEPNPYRVGEVVSINSFGTLNFNFNKKQVIFKMIGDNGAVLNKLQQDY